MRNLLLSILISAAFAVSIEAGVLTRLYDFEPGEPIYSQEVDDEFNQIINAFSGVSTSKYLYVKNNSTTEPACRVDQLGSGPIAEFKKSGTTKVSINNTGQVVSTVTTIVGAPFSIVSESKVTHLNVDFLDGLDSTDFLLGDGSATPTFTDNVTITGAGPQLTFEDTTSGDDDFSISADADVLSFMRDTGVGPATTIATLSTAGQLSLPITTGTSPLAVSSTTKVDNLNCDLLDGLDSTEIASLVSTQTETIPEGGGSPAATITVTASVVKIDCQDILDGCSVDLSESGIDDGFLVTLVIVGSGGVGITDVDGQQELSATFTGGQWDTLVLRYITDRWVEISRSNN